jgi:hypothetical protein
MFRLSAFAAAIVLAGCTAVGPYHAVPAPTTTQVASLAPTRIPEDHSEEPIGLAPTRRAELGLPPPGQATGELPALSAGQWADPEAVAARLVVVDCSYSAAEDPAEVAARRATYTTTRLADDLGLSSSGGARLALLRQRRVAFVGEVLSLATTTQSPDVTVVEVVARLTTTSADQVPEQQVRFYRLTLVREPAARRWLVARVEQS